MWRLRYYLEKIQTTLWCFLVQRCLPLLAQNRLEIYRQLRRLVSFFVVLATILAIASPFFHLVKMLALAGLMFDVAGVIRLFMDEEWDELLEHYRDVTKYPNGPPSYVTRELFADSNVEVTIDTEEFDVARYYYYRRGFLLIIGGFLMQALAVMLA